MDLTREIQTAVAASKKAQEARAAAPTSPPEAPDAPDASDALDASSGSADPRLWAPEDPVMRAARKSITAFTDTCVRIHLL